MDQFIEGQLGGYVLACPDGYELRSVWVDLYSTGHYTPTQVIVARSLIGKVVPVMGNPKTKNLHHKFARVARGRRGGTADQVLSFVHQYGLLDGTAEAFDRWGRLPDGTWDYRPIGFPCDRFWDWQEASDEMAALIALWELVRDAPGDILARRRLAEHVRRDNGTIRLYYGWDGRELNTNPSFFQRAMAPRVRGDDGTAEWQVIADENALQYQALFERFPQLRGPKFDVALAARMYLYREVERNLRGRFSARMAIERPAASALVFEPLNLRGAIWLHFAYEIMGSGPVQQRCEFPGCRKMFPIDPRKKFCSNACRQANDRAKRRTRRDHGLPKQEEM